MPLVGRAAMVLLFDIAPDAIADHDDWHTHEHLPERLAIPGFLRGTRWVATEGGPRYLVVYEVAGLATLSSAPYLARLDAPSAWTSRVMPHYRGMRRGFCTVAASVGYGSGHAARVVRFAPADGAGPRLHRWLADEVLPPLASQPGIGSAHLLVGAATPPMTNEQRIRGTDAGVDGVLIVTAYRADALAGALDEAWRERLEAEGARDIVVADYRYDYSLGRDEVGADGRHGA